MDLYLFISVTPQATKDEIKKAYKLKARDLHPDKNPDPKAGELFDRLRTISAFLQDDKKREMYDKYRQQKELRKRKLEEEDSGRRNLRKELERREEAFRLSKMQENRLSEAERARAQTEKLIEEMMKSGILPSSYGSTSTPSASPSFSRPSPAVSSSSLPTKPTKPLFKADSATSTTVMIAWEQKKPKEWQVELRVLLERYGSVGDLIVSKKKAIAVFATATQAAAAVSNNHQHPSLKFKLKPLASAEEEEFEQSSAGDRPQEPKKTAPTPLPFPDAPSYNDDYEAETMQLLLRRHQEKIASS